MRRQLCNKSVSSSRTCSACWTDSASCLEQIEKHEVVDNLFVSSFINHAMYCNTILYTKYYMTVCSAACRWAWRQKNQINDFAAADIINLLFYFHEIILQNSVILYQYFSNHFIWNHSVFQHKIYVIFLQKIKICQNIKISNQLSIFYQIIS